MSNETFMIGTKFFRHIGKTEVPEIIRLKKQEGNILYFDNGKYNATVLNDEFRTMVVNGELVQDSEDKYYRIFDYFGTTIKQVWTMINNSEDQFIKFKVDNIGMKMTIEELKKNYIRLIPDGFFTISNIDYPINYGKDRGYDVLCTLAKGRNTVPDIICRQDTIDVFKYSNESKYVPIGISIPRKACPSNMDYQVFMYAENIKDFRAIACYIDDSINTVLKYVGPLNRYNATMKKLYEKYRGTKMAGCNQNVYDLLVNTGFDRDFYELFGVLPYPFAIDMSRSVMNEKEENIINSVINTDKNHRMTNIIYAPYDRGVDMSQIDSKYVLVNAGNNSQPAIFIFSYVFEDASE